VAQLIAAVNHQLHSGPLLINHLRMGYAMTHGFIPEKFGYLVRTHRITATFLMPTLRNAMIAAALCLSATTLRSSFP
jgi:hypothetical protein